MSYLPKAIDIPSNPECMSCISANQDTTCLNGIFDRDKQELAEELIWLRKTSKAALQESWKEIEGLRCQCSEYAKVETRLNEHLTESRREEKKWRIRCLTTETIKAISIEEENLHGDSRTRPHSLGSLGEINEKRSHVVNNRIQQSPKSNPLLTFCNKMRLLPSGNLRCMDEPLKRLLSKARKEIPCSNKNGSFNPIVRSCVSKYSPNRDEDYLQAAETNMQQELDSPPVRPSNCTSCHSQDTDATEEGCFIEEEFFIETEVHTTGEISKSNQIYLHGNAKSQDELSLQISSRDGIITSLEDTLNQELSSMQKMRHDMMCLMENQQIKERRIDISHKQEEERLNNLVASLRGKLETNDIISKKMDKDLLECKVYIHELANKLEKALKVVKRAEEGGFLPENNFCQ